MWLQNPVYFYAAISRHNPNIASAINEAEFVGEAILELLRDNRVEEIFSPPDIVNPLSVSV